MSLGDSRWLSSRGASNRSRVSMLCLSCLLGLAASMAVSYSLWIGPRTFPALPMIGVSSPAWDRGAQWVGLLLACAVVVALVEFARRAPSAMQSARLVILAYICAIFVDQTRLQPWAYLDVLLLTCVATLGARETEQSDQESEDAMAVALVWCRCILIAMYAFSALHKLNLAFFDRVIPFLLTGVLPDVSLSTRASFVLGGVMIATELSVAGLLARPATRRAGATLGSAMHFTICLLLGPWGADFNAVVWPWNVCMVALLWCVVSDEADVCVLQRRVPEAWWTSAWLTRKQRWLGVALLGLAMVMPAFGFVGWWDRNLSWAMYTGRAPAARLSRPAVRFLATGTSAFVASQRCEHDPFWRQLETQWRKTGDHVQSVALDAWSRRELGVPMLAESRAFAALWLRVCTCADPADSLSLVVRTRHLAGDATTRTARCRPQRVGRSPSAFAKGEDSQEL